MTRPTVENIFDGAQLSTAPVSLFGHTYKLLRAGCRRYSRPSLLFFFFSYSFFYSTCRSSFRQKERRAVAFLLHVPLCYHLQQVDVGEQALRQTRVLKRLEQLQYIVQRAVGSIGIADPSTASNPASAADSSRLAAAPTVGACWPPRRISPCFVAIMVVVDVVHVWAQFVELVPKLVPSWLDDLEGEKLSEDRTEEENKKK